MNALDQEPLRDGIGFGKKHLTMYKLKKLRAIRELEGQMTFPAKKTTWGILE
jgi:hypothetical protein